MCSYLKIPCNAKHNHVHVLYIQTIRKDKAIAVSIPQKIKAVGKFQTISERHTHFKERTDGKKS